MSKPVHPKIMDEEFHDYQTLLDGMEVDPTPISLPSLPLLGPTPTASGQNKRNITSMDPPGEEETWDTSASGSGAVKSGTAPGVATPLMLTETPGVAAGDPANPSEIPSREEAVHTFLAAPLLPDPAAMKIDHVMAMLALASGGPIKQTAIHLLNQAYPKQMADRIWAAWAPHILPPPGHILEGPNTPKDVVMAALRKVPTTPEEATKTAKTLLDAIAGTITATTFVEHALTDLVDKEILPEVLIGSH
jgi:hypothetical protein